MADIKQKEENIDFTALAKQIDSTIDPEFEELLKQIELWNILLKWDMFGNEELIPVGSCVDGSKVTLPIDCGDIDVLIVSNSVILKEYLFDYDYAFPAFLHIRVNNEHQKYFKTVKDPIEGVYLPITVLKEFRERSFLLSKIFTQYDSQGGLAEDGKFLYVTRPTAVGKEHMLLHPDKKNALDFIDEPETLNSSLTRMGRFVKCGLRKMINLTKSTVKKDAKGRPSTIDTNNRSNLTDHDDISLLEMLHEFLDMCEGKETDNDKTRLISNTNEDCHTSAADDGKETEKADSKATSDIFSAESVRADIYKRKLSQDCTTTQTKRNNASSNFKRENNVLNLDTVEVNENCTVEADASVQQLSKQTTAKPETSFSKLKSTDFVPAFRFEGWPRVAGEWVTRSRKWPSKVTLKKVLEAGCQVVAKRPLATYSKPINEDRDPYFRLSFALSEIILARSMKEEQLLCWRVLKAYQKCFLQTKPKCLTSYHWKNVLFWVNEDLGESFWTDENVLVAVLKCLDFMKDCLQQRNLPFYFVRKMNLFNGFEGTFFDCLRHVEAIRREPLEFLKRFITEPPYSDTHFIDNREIEDILSKEAKAKNTDRMLEEMINWFNHVPYFHKIDGRAIPDFQQFYTAVRQAWSKVDESSSDDSKDPQNSDRSRQKKLKDQVEKIMASMEKKDKVAADKAFVDMFQTIAHDFEPYSELDTSFEKARKQSIGNIFTSLSPIVTGTQEHDGSSENTCKFLSGFHQLVVLMQEDFEHKACDESKRKATNENNELFSVFTDAAIKFIEGMQKSNQNEDKTFSLSDEIRKTLNEAAQKIEVITGRKDVKKKKAEMDIDLD